MADNGPRCELFNGKIWFDKRYPPTEAEIEAARRLPDEGAVQQRIAEQIYATCKALVMKTGPLCALLCLTASLASAQTVTNPTKAEFIASVDHNTVVNGLPVLTSYQLDTMTGTATGALAFTVSLGKPTPGAGNLISVVVPQLAALSNGTYVATVSAIGPGGAGKSVPSAPFVRIGPPAVPTAVRVAE